MTIFDKLIIDPGQEQYASTNPPVLGMEDISEVYSKKGREGLFQLLQAELVKYQQIEA